MPSIKSHLFISCLLFVLCFGCNEVNPKGEKEVLEFVKQWNDDHTPIKSPYLERDYMDVVTYYGKERTKSQVQADKNLLFQQFPDYTQSILNDQIDVTKENGSFLVTFTKHVTYNGIEADYPSYLTVIIKNGAVKILREGVSKTANTDAPIFPSAREGTTSIAGNRQIFGDFNGDGLSDYASVISPVISSTKQTEVQCEGGCNSVIVFSNNALEAITINGAYQSQLENLKDINSDGAEEVGFWDIKPTTKSLYVFDALHNKLLCEPIVINTAIHKNLNLIDVFKKTGPNKITVTRSAQVNGKWILQSEVIVLD
ncbi:hypothetical protein NA63_2230 [Flavobacteriaceae bacterium MAR_2010_105]|nr:hypothetical protein NA63_2230 [Flavobacteriaceae bacterium MAR_2010_105]